MSRILAIDWDRHEARAILLQSGPTGTSVAGAWSTKLAAPEEGVAVSGKQVGERLSAVMGGESVGKATTIVGVGRDNTQIKLLTLPPAPEDELPELVRFQAEREFTALGSEAALDYIPLSGGAETAHQVLAVALSPAGITEAREAAQAAGAEVTRIAVRALAVVSLAERANQINATSVSLVVNPLIEEADLAVVDQGKVSFLRTVRLPEAEQAAGRQRALVNAIRTTMAAANQTLGGRSIEQVVLCGNASAVDQAESLGDLGIAVKMFDPATAAPSGLAATGVPPASLARFAAVLGMAQGEVDRRPPIVDFLNVRRKVEARKFGPEHTLMAVAAALLVLLIGGYLWFKSHRISSQVTSIKAEIKTKNEEIKKLKPLTDQVAAITQWRSTDVNWLDELVDVSNHLRPKPMPKTFDQDQQMIKDGTPFPEKLDVLIKQQLVFTKPIERNSAGGGLVNIMQAIAKDQDAASSLEYRFWEDERVDDGLTVSSNSGTADASVPGYTWKLDYTITVPPPDSPDIPAEVILPNAKPAAAKPAATEAAKAGAEAAGKAAPTAFAEKDKQEKAAPAAADKKESVPAADKKEAK